MKSYTDIKQSKAISKILPPESADMYYFDDNGGEPNFKVRNGITYYYDSEDCLCCWSLAALLDVLPNKLQIALAINDFQGDRKEKYVIGSVEHDEYDCYADNPVDACYEMIIKLNELNLL